MNRSEGDWIRDALFHAEHLSFGKKKPTEPNERDGASIRTIFGGVLLGPHSDRGLQHLSEAGVIDELLPEVSPIIGFGGRGKGHKDLWWHTKMVVKQAYRTFDVKWAALLHDIGKPSCFYKKDGKVMFHGHEEASARLAERVRKRTGLFDSRVVDLVRALGRVEAYYTGWADSAVRRIDKEVPDDILWDAIRLAHADCTSKHAHNRAANHSRMEGLAKRITELRALDDLARVRRLPKGLGTVITEKYGLKGKQLGDAIRSIQELVNIGELEPGRDSAYYAASLGDHE